MCSAWDFYLQFSKDYFKQCLECIEESILLWFFNIENSFIDLKAFNIKIFWLITVSNFLNPFLFLELIANLTITHFLKLKSNKFSIIMRPFQNLDESFHFYHAFFNLDFIIIYSTAIALSPTCQAHSFIVYMAYSFNFRNLLSKLTKALHSLTLYFHKKKHFLNLESGLDWVFDNLFSDRFTWDSSRWFYMKSLRYMRVRERNLPAPAGLSMGSYCVPSASSSSV